MIQGFCFGAIFILTTADLLFKIRHYEQVDAVNAICISFALIGFVHAIW